MPATKKATGSKSTKTAKKKATGTKKASSRTKKPATKKVAKKAATLSLVCAPKHECFWTTDGQILHDLRELRDAFENMSDEVFKHHVTKDKNDFADWVEYVLRDGKCATALRKSKKATTARTVVVRSLRSYTL